MRIENDVLSAVWQLDAFKIICQNIVLVNWYKSINISKILIMYCGNEVFFQYKMFQINEEIKLLMINF